MRAVSLLHCIPVPTLFLRHLRPFEGEIVDSELNVEQSETTYNIILHLRDLRQSYNTATIHHLLASPQVKMIFTVLPTSSDFIPMKSDRSDSVLSDRINLELEQFRLPQLRCLKNININRAQTRTTTDEWLCCQQFEFCSLQTLITGRHTRLVT